MESKLPFFDDREPGEDPNWPALMRATLMAAILAKQVNYVELADRRAIAMITINAVMLPVALSRVPQELPAFIFIAFGILSLISGVSCLLPKPYTRGVGRDYGLLHFTGITNYSEPEYLEKMRVMLLDRNSLVEHFCSDLYHLSHFILIPKFRWVKVSYLAFLIGLLATLGAYLIPVIQVALDNLA